MLCVSINVEACLVLRVGNSMALGTSSKIQYVLWSSLHILYNPGYRTDRLSSSTWIELYHWLISSRLEEHRACYRKAMSNAEYVAHPLLSTS